MVGNSYSFLYIWKWGYPFVTRPVLPPSPCWVSVNLFNRLYYIILSWARQGNRNVFRRESSFYLLLLEKQLTMMKLYIVVLALNTGTMFVSARSPAELTGTDLEIIVRHVYWVKNLRCLFVVQGFALVNPKKHARNWFCFPQGYEDAQSAPPHSSQRV